MKTEELLKELILSRYKSIRAFALDNDIPYSTVNNLFERGIGNIGIGTAIKICDIMQLDVDALAKGTIKIKEAIFEERLSKSELTHIDKYRTLDDYGKNMVDTITEMEYTRCTAKPKVVHIETKNIDDDHLMPIAAHNDNLSEEEIALMREDLEDM